MRTPRTVVVLAILAATTVTAGAAQAASPQAGTCGNETLSGTHTYSSLRVTGTCTVEAGADITVMQNLSVAPGAVFDAQGAPSTVNIGGNVIAARGSMFGLGCTPAHGCENGGPYSVTSVGGNIILNHVYNAAINGVTVGGNVVSYGGGAGFVMTSDSPETSEHFVPFSMKDDVIHGNVVVHGLTTSWFGLIRSTVDGTVVLRDIHLDDPDGNEVVNDTVGGNLVCFGNDPAPQLGDAVTGAPPGYGPTTVGGRAVGQCSSIN